MSAPYQTRPDLEQPNIEESDSTRHCSPHSRAAFFVFLLASIWTVTVTVICRLLMSAPDLFPFTPEQVDELFLAMRLHGVLAGVLVLTTLVVRRRGSPTMAKIGLLGFVAIFVLTLDRGFSVAFPPRGEDVPAVARHKRRGFAHRVNARGYIGGCTIETNQLGFRGGPIPQEKAEDEYRVLMLGDSTTFGFLLSDEQTAAAELERMLSNRYPEKKFRCMNSGVCGYATWQQLDLMKHEGVASKPDLVVLTFCHNDMIDIIDIGRTVPPGGMFFELDYESHWSGLYRAIRHWTAVKVDRELADEQAWAQNQVNPNQHSPVLKDVEDIYAQPTLPFVAEAWKLCLEDLGQIQAICKKMDVPFLLAYTPLRRELTHDPKYRLPGKKLADWAAEHNVPYVDLTDAYLKMLANGQAIDDILYDTMHFRANATEIMAKELSELIIKSEVIPK